MYNATKNCSTLHSYECLQSSFVSKNVQSVTFLRLDEFLNTLE